MRWRRAGAAGVLAGLLLGAGMRAAVLPSAGAEQTFPEVRFTPPSLTAPTPPAPQIEPPAFVVSAGRLAHDALAFPFLLICAPFNLSDVRAGTYSLADVSDTFTEFGDRVQGVETGVRDRLNAATRHVLPRSSLELHDGVEWMLYQIKF